MDKSNVLLFFRFLKDERIYEKYLFYIKQSSRNHIKKLLRAEPFQYINCIKWSATMEGDSFWLIMHLKWKGFLYDYYKKRKAFIQL
jgi:hypothetical protein